MKVIQLRGTGVASRPFPASIQQRILTVLTCGWHTAMELAQELHLDPGEWSDVRRELDDLVRKGVLARAATPDGHVRFGFAHRLGKIR